MISHMLRRRRWQAAIIAFMLFASSLGAIPVHAQGVRCFSETGYCIDGRIREFWEQNGGLPVFGLPKSDVHPENIEGQQVMLQWFERNRLELHPENARPNDVLLGRLGADRLAQQGRDWTQFGKVDPNSNPKPPDYHPETGHGVSNPLFYNYYHSHGLDLDGQPGFSPAESLALFGLPLSELQHETLSDGQVYLVQWYERARFEQHGNQVLLGLLGNEVHVAPQPSNAE